MSTTKASSRYCYYYSCILHNFFKIIYLFDILTIIFILIFSRQNYPTAHGGTSFSFSYGINSRRPQWLIVGQEGGTIVRTQASRILNATNESSVSFLSILFLF